MFKFLKSLPVLTVLFLAFVGVVKANGLLMVKSVDMPAYVNKEPFNISYTALEANGNPIEVIGYIKKDGSGWQEVASSTKLSDTFEINSNFWAEGPGLYKIYFIAKSASETVSSDEESFNIDFTPPDPVSNYRKDRKDALVYKICWKNPDDEDFNRVIIYRSDKTEFTADSSTQITEVSGGKDEEKCFENNIPENKNYYYVTRTVDHAGNASSVVGDSEVTVTTTSSVLGTSMTPTQAPTVVSLPESQVTPAEQQAQEGQILGGTTDEGEISQPGVIQQVTQKVAGLGWLRILGIVVIILGIVILLVSLLKKRQ